MNSRLIGLDVNRWHLLRCDEWKKFFVILRAKILILKMKLKMN